MPRQFNAFAGITGVAYAWKHHWKAIILTGLVVFPLLFVWRLLSGRNLFGGGRTTDATFTRGARSVRKGWWNDLPGVVRAGFRIAVIAGLLLWFVAPALVIAMVVLELLVTVASVVRRVRERRHERHVLRPVWPAVAGIIGVPDTEPPARWLDIPSTYRDNPTHPDAEITVGLRAADADDERRVRDLVTLFSQRNSVAHYGRVDYASRLVHIRARPVEPYCWPAVANVLGVDSGALAQEWVTVPDDINPGAQIVVTLPSDVVNNVPIRDELARVINQQFPGEWSSRVDRATDTTPARVVLTRKAPPPTPPNFVDFLAEHPDYQQQEAN